MQGLSVPVSFDTLLRSTPLRKDLQPDTLLHTADNATYEIESTTGGTAILYPNWHLQGKLQEVEK